jgi:hypothetical protein
MPKVSEISALPVQGWAKGLNRDADPILLGVDETPDSLNIEFGPRGEARRRDGYVAHIAPTAGTPAKPLAFRQLFLFNPTFGANAGHTLLVGVTLLGTVWYANLTDGASSFTEITYSGASLDLGSTVSVKGWTKAMAQLNGILLMSSEALGGVYWWDGESASSVRWTYLSNLDAGSVWTRLTEALASNTEEMILDSRAGLPTSATNFTLLCGQEQIRVVDGQGADSSGTLAADINNSTTTVTLDAAPNIANSAFTARIGTEQVRVTAGMNTTTWTVTRGYNSTTPAAHTDGDTITFMYSVQRGYSSTSAVAHSADQVITLANSVDMCRAKSYAVWNDRVWAGNYYDGDVWQGSNILPSALVDPLDWDATNYIQVNPDDGQFITCLVPFGQSLLIFKNSSLYALVGSDPTTATLWPLNMAIGTTAVGSIAEAANKVFFFSPGNGVFTYDGAAVKPIDQAIRRYLLSNIPAASAHRCSGFIRENQYHLSVPWGAEIHANLRRFVYDIETGRWEEHTLGLAAAVFWEGTWIGAGGQDWDTAASITLFAGAHADGGVDFNWNLETAWLPGPEERAGRGQFRLRRLIIHLKGFDPAGGEEEASCTMSLYRDFDDATAVATATITYHTASEGYIFNFADYDGLFDVLRIRLEGTQQQHFEVATVTLLLSERAPKRAWGASVGATVSPRSIEGGVTMTRPTKMGT